MLRKFLLVFINLRLKNSLPVIWTGYPTADVKCFCCNYILKLYQSDDIALLGRNVERLFRLLSFCFFRPISEE